MFWEKGGFSHNLSSAAYHYIGWVGIKMWGSYDFHIFMSFIKISISTKIKFIKKPPKNRWFLR